MTVQKINLLGCVLDVIIIMLIGVIVGNKIFPQKLKMINENFQIVTVIVLIFTMGVSLGKEADFLENLFTLGAVSILYAIVPIIFSVISVYFLTKIFMKSKGDTQ